MGGPHGPGGGEAPPGIDREETAVERIVEKRCPACGGPLKKLLRQYQAVDGPGVDRKAPELEGISAIFLELWACPACGKGELYVDYPRQEREERVTCPVCGAEHSPGVGCPRCAMNRAMSGQKLLGKKLPAQKRHKETKPPWEG